MSIVRLFAIAVLMAIGAGCPSSPLPMSRSPGNAACGDPCASMVCPSGNVCSWNERCQPRCDPQPLPNFSR